MRKKKDAKISKTVLVYFKRKKGVGKIASLETKKKNISILGWSNGLIENKHF